MGKAKDFLIERSRKTRDGKTEYTTIKLGDLSKNELCRGILELQNSNQQFQAALNNAYLIYSNHIASQDGMSPEEWVQFINQKREYEPKQ